MWPRKQLDIERADFIFALRQLLWSWSRPTVEDTVGRRWIPSDEVLVALSVRTGWDLLLSALSLPRGSEIIMSAVTIPDMPRIVEHHGLVPVSVAVDAARLEPSISEIEKAITPRTRAILIAHLFGSRVEMGPIIELARRYNFFVIEDCAQAFVGVDYAGHAESDAALFSFGPIKTATALGGAILRIPDRKLRDCMERLHGEYPVQSRLAWAGRVAKYAAFSWLSRPRIFAALVHCYEKLGIDADRAFAEATHSFDASQFFTQIRQRPCVPLIRMLGRRLATFGNNERLRRRTLRGRRLANVLLPQAVPGALNSTHTYWVLPVRVANPATALSALREAGFDATSRSSLVAVANQNGGCDDPLRLAPWLGETIFLPNGDDLTDSEFDRMLEVLVANVERREIPHQDGAAI